MSEGDYLDLVSQSPNPPARVAGSLADQCREVIARDVVGKELTEMSPADRAGFDGYLGTKTAAIRGAEPAQGKFPLVIYVQGAGSSLQDNSGMCEFLASNGYVVVGSAFQREDGRMIADLDTVASDIRALIAQARKFPNIDLSKVAVIGHSAGAQSAIYYASQKGAIVDAVVSLDSTQDYYFLNSDWFMKYVARVEAENVTMPMLVAADDSAIYSLTDSMVNSARTYLIVDELGHEEYTSQGLGAAAHQKPIGLPLVREKFRTLCETTLSFLDQNLKGTAPRQLTSRYFRLESVPIGSREPTLYEMAKEPPTPRQLRLLFERNPEKAIEILESFAKSEPKPLFSGQLGFAIVDYLLTRSAVAEARKVSALYDRVLRRDVTGTGTFARWGNIFAANGSIDRAIGCYSKALLLDPENHPAREALSKLKVGLTTTTCSTTEDRLLKSTPCAQ